MTPCATPPPDTRRRMQTPRIELVRLGQVAPEDIVALHNDPRVLKHMPLAIGHFGLAECARWVEDKERQWRENGFGPWAILVDGAFAGWGGFQREAGDADLALVLFPAHWGAGRMICRRMLELGFGQLGLTEVTALLPPSRTRLGALARFGFQPAGERIIDGQRFMRFTLARP